MLHPGDSLCWGVWGPMGKEALGPCLHGPSHTYTHSTSRV